MTGWDWLLLGVVGLAVAAGVWVKWLSLLRDDDRQENDRGGPR